MFKLMMMAGLFGGVAEAAPFDVDAPDERAERRGPFSGTPIEQATDKLEEKKTAKQLAAEERLRKLNESRKGSGSRVVVLQELITDISYQNETLRRNVKSRLKRPSAKFYPDVDLYQNGRKEPDPTLRPLDQRGSVPDEVIGQIDEAWKSVSAIPWNALDETEWGERASRLKSLADSVWFIDRPELRAPLFNLYAQIGRAAENSNNPIPPFFEQVALVDVNYYFYLAASMASRDPSLMSDLTDGELYQNVDYLRQRLDAGEFAPMTLNFELGGRFDADKFANDYIVFFNGIDDVVTNDQALYDVPPGRMDVFLQRGDSGYGMSVKVESVKVTRENLESVRDQARKRMGIDFIEQLMENPEECIPDVEGDILNYLAIYQKLHPTDEIYIAVPEAGSANRIYVWKWVADQGVLRRINDNTGGFPVRFVALLGTGLSFNGANLKAPNELAYLKAPPTGEPSPPDVAEFLSLSASSAPIAYELRGHWNRVMVGVGMDYAVSVSGSGSGFKEIPRTQTKDHQVSADGVVAVSKNRILLDNLETNGSGDPIPYLREFDFQRGIFMNVAGVLGKDASAGFGPRIGARTGWYNAPRAIDLTAHAGWALALSKGKKEDEEKADSRVKGLIDTDVFVGAMVPTGDTLLLLKPIINPTAGMTNVVGFNRIERGSKDVCTTSVGDSSCNVKKFGAAIPNFGFTLKAGLTF